MKRIVVASMAALALSGCAQFYLAFGIATNETPVVRVGAKEISAVDPDPLRFARGQGEVTITWQLGIGSSNRFAANGITIDGDVTKSDRPAPQTEILKCSVSEDRTRASCVNRNTRPGRYKYTVRLESADGRALPAFDPHIVNME